MAMKMKQSAHSILALVAALAATSAVGGCGGFSKAVGADKSAPDEFKVLTKPPLVIPPEYALRPPRPGDARGGVIDPSAQAQAALFGRDIGREASRGERALVSAAGAEAVDYNIREVVDLESADLVRKGQAFADRVIQFQEGSDPLAPADPQLKLAEEEATRRVTGGEPVIIERKEGRGKLPGL